MALLVLVLTLGSLLAAGIPLLTAVLGVGITMAGMSSLASFVSINTSTPSLAMMIGLAVGIDYALFLVSRHRSQLAAGIGVEESVARSVATAGSAVIFAGVTVIIALCGLVVARIPFLTVMGLAGAAAVAVAVVVAVTLVPAILGIAGERLGRVPAAEPPQAVAEPGETHTRRRPLGRGGDPGPVLTVVGGGRRPAADGAAGQGPRARAARQRLCRARLAGSGRPTT